MAEQSTDELRIQAEFDRHMTAAHVYRNRGDYPGATEEIRKALALKPDDLAAREFAADMVFAHGEVEKAAEHYKSILDVDPSRTSVEEKFAKAILQVAEGKRQQDLLKEMMENPRAHSPAPRSGGLAAILSIAPGFGHIYCGQYIKGMIIFAAWALAWVLCLSFVGLPGHRLTTATVFFGCLATSLHLYAVVDAASAAEKTRKGAALTEPQ